MQRLLPRAGAARRKPLTGAPLARPRARGGTRMKRLLSLALFFLLAGAVFAQDSGYSGQWMVDQSRDPAKLQLTFRYSGPEGASDWNNWGSPWGPPVPRPSLPGFPDQSLNRGAPRSRSTSFV